MIRRKGDWEFELEWGDIFFAILALFTVALATVIIMCMTSEKVIEGYTLDQANNGRLYIEKNVNWASDSSIELERSTTVQEAMKMVDSLNATLPIK